MKLHQLALLSLFISIGAIRSAQADTWIPRPPGNGFGIGGSHLGTSVAIGDYSTNGNKTIGSVYVGAPTQDVGAISEAGVVHVFTFGPQGWTHAGYVFPSVPQAGAHFGASVAYSAGHLVVASPGAGSVEFFNDSESPTAHVVSETVTTGVGASAVAADGDMAAIGSSQFNNGNGSAYVYQRNASGQWQIFNGNAVVTGGVGGELGASVAIRQTSSTTFIMVAGAPAETQNAHALAGAVHIYIENVQGTGLLDIGPLTAQNPAFLDVFGTSVGIDANYIYVGATGRDNGAGRVGSVTIFQQGTIFGYNYLAEYFPGTPATIGGHCGASLSVDAANSQFILGCPNSDDVYFAGVGTARVYRQFVFLGQTVWLESVLDFGTALHGAGDALGSSVSIYGDHAFVGAPNANLHAAGQGRVSEFVPDKIFQDGFGG
jgi:hypothetical protein